MATFTWNGGATNSNMTSGANWVGGAAPVANAQDTILEFAGSTNPAPFNDYTAYNTGILVQGIQFKQGAAAFTIARVAGSYVNTLTILSGGITNYAATNQTIKCDVALGQNQVWNLGSANLTFTAPVSDAPGGSYALTKEGAGMLSFSGAYHSMGAITVNGGAIKFVFGGNWTTSTAPMTLDSSTRAVQLWTSIGPSRPITVTGANTCSFYRVGSTVPVYGGVISGSANIEVVDARFAAANTYTGSTTITSSLVVANALALQNSSSVVINGGNLSLISGVTLNKALRLQKGKCSMAETGTAPAATFAGAISLVDDPGDRALEAGASNTLWFTGPISGSSSLKKLGRGTVRLSAANTGFSGPLTHVAGVLYAHHPQALGTGMTTLESTATSTGSADYAILWFELPTGSTVSTPMTLKNGQVWSKESITLTAPVNLAMPSTASSTRQLTMPVGKTMTIPGVVGSAPFWKSGPGNLVLNGDSSAYTGETSIVWGTLQIGAGGTTGSLGGSIVNGSNLTFNRSGTLEHAGAISGTGTVTIAGPGTIVLSSPNNSYDGATYVNAGTLVAASPAALGGTGSTVVASGAKLTIANSVTIANESVVLNGGTLAGMGTATLAGSVVLGASNSSLEATAPEDKLVVSCAINGGVSSDVLYKTGMGSVVLTAANAFPGTVCVNAGRLQIGNGKGGSLAGAIVNNAHVIFDYSEAVTCNNTISGAGGVTKAGAGMLTLTGANAGYSGRFSIDAGSVVASHSTALGLGMVVVSARASLSVVDRVVMPNELMMDGGTLIATGSARIAGPLTLQQDSTFDVPAPDSALVLDGGINGSGAMTKTGSGRAIVVLRNSVEGRLNLAEGSMLVVSEASATSSSSLPNMGQIVVHPNAYLSLLGLLTVKDVVNDGKIEVNMMDGEPAMGSPGGAVFSGSITGSGSFGGDVTFGGSFAPGSATAPATVSVDGGLECTSTSTVIMKLLNEKECDSLQVSGNVSVKGTFRVSLAGSLPPVGTSYTLMTYASASFKPAKIELPPLPAEYAWSLADRGTRLELMLVVGADKMVG